MNLRGINKNSIPIMLYTTKVITILFMAIMAYENLPNYGIFTRININNSFNIYSSIFFACISGLILLNCILVGNIGNLSIVKLKVLQLGETVFFMFVTFLFMYLDTSDASEFKCIFLILIVTSIIQFGIRRGLAITLLCNFMILGSDLIKFSAVNGINNRFNQDLIVAGVFIFVAWVLGYYVDIVNQNNKRNNERLYLLNTELIEQDKERYRIEEMLIKNEMCYDMLFENSQSAVIVHNDGKIIYANESAAKLLGYGSPDELNEKLLYYYYRHYKKNNLENKYLNIVNNKISKFIEDETIINNTGNLISVRNTSSYFAYEGESTVLTLLLDITSEKQIETLKKDVQDNEKLLNETREYNTLITDFLINISHELKTPINVIYVAIQTMSMYLENRNSNNELKYKSYLKMMKQNCHRLIRLVNNLLDVTKIDSGFIKFIPHNGDIVNTVENIVLSVALYTKSKDINIIFDTDVEEKVMAFDHDKIERVILNLISNAFKYTSDGGEINVELQDMGERVKIVVEDNGEGIPKDKVNSIFERFAQVNRSISRENEGSGIGLYLAKSFVEIHGGKIGVESIEGKGSKFIIELPAKIIEEEEYQPKNLYENNVDKISIEFSDIYTMNNEGS